MKQLSNIAFQVENLQKVATFPEFSPFYEAHEKFQRGVTDIIENSIKKMEEDKDYLLGSSEGAILMRQNIKILQDELNVALTDIKLRRQTIFANHVGAYIKAVHAELHDYKDRIQNEPMYQNSIRPFLQLYNTDFKQLYSRFTRLMTPLDFENIPQKVVTHTIEQLKRLTATLTSTLIPMVSHSRTAKLITSIFIEKYNAQFIPLIHSMNNAPLFNERIRFLDTAIADLMTEFNLYFSTLQKQRPQSDFAKKPRSPSKSQVVRSQSSLVSSERIISYTLECELGKTKDKLDEALLTIANMKQQTKNQKENFQRLDEVLNLIYSRLRPLAKKDPTKPEMQTLDKIYKTIGQIELELADLDSKHKKADWLREKLIKIGLLLHQNDENKEKPRSMTNEELVDDILSHVENGFRNKVNNMYHDYQNDVDQEKIAEMSDDEMIKELKSKLDALQGLHNNISKNLEKIDPNNKDSDKLSNKELGEKLDSEIEKLKAEIAKGNDVNEKIQSTYKHAGGNKEESPLDMLKFIDDKLDNADKIADKMHGLLKDRGLNESDLEGKSPDELFDLISNSAKEDQKLKDKLMDTYKDLTGKDFDSKNQPLSEIFDKISNVAKENKSLREKLIQIYSMLGGSKKSVSDKTNNEIADLIIEKLKELTGEIRKMFTNDPGSSVAPVDLIKMLSSKMPRVKSYHKQLSDIHDCLCNKNGSDSDDSEHDLDDDDLIRDIHGECDNILALRKKLIDCYVEGSSEKESQQELKNIASKLSNLELVDEISKNSQDRIDSIHALQAALPNAKDQNSFPLSKKIIAEVEELRKRTSRTHDSIANLADTLSKLKAFPEISCCSDDADIVSSVSKNIGEILNNSSIFRCILEEKFVKLGGHRDKIRNLDDVGLLKALINLYDSINYNLIMKIRKRLIEIIKDYEKLDGDENIDELLEIIERLLKNRPQKVESQKPRVKTTENCAQTDPISNELESKSINGLREVLIRITGKKGSTFDRKDVDEMLQIALPKIDEIIGANIDGTSIVFEKIKDLLPPNTNRNQFLGVLRDMVIKRNNTNEMCLKMAKHLTEILKTLSVGHDNVDCESLYNHVQDLVNESNYILPNEVESDVHGLIINMNDALMNSSTFLISLMQNSIGNSEITSKYDESLKTNLLLSKEVSKMRKLIDEKDAQLSVETEKLQTAEKTFRSFAESSSALLEKSVRQVRQQFLDEKSKATSNPEQ
ncbi:hypothetical protein TVAG_237710 [Trichomonas vaginalis G3]|uniref:Uncharacterized protein n=1 Tax=Trichomonas vaginalis (strain ATCC PRA-98 / G3) TaxID=412133 RepID=A2DCX1_TRIV3|nr:hypothetical protein TVAGG3_0606500 [Trichomonas vaginalis G3]EAY21745.1 hypothetical protein TVAG_237710 [Trichomonas vaginalis G3]KAI5524280.1 hypothetical protein TVAGG3_0606500 [Trichomonas vaginalis G3]|eukprot:XP_001582731.1 hypothetical protein [Trichomonas vaginalis G3]